MEGFKMGLRKAKKKKNNSSDYVGFRAKDDKQKVEFYNRADTLKDSKGYSKADIFEAGLLALEDGRSIEQTKRKQTKAINERDYYLREAKALNEEVKALNRQFKFIHKLENTDLNNNVLTFKILDKDGREYEL